MAVGMTSRHFDNLTDSVPPFVEDVANFVSNLNFELSAIVSVDFENLLEQIDHSMWSR